jgi:hypothetical protein
MRFLLNFSIKAISSMNESVFFKILTKRPNNTSRFEDPGCLSRILIFTHPGFRILDLGSRIQKQQQKIRVKKKFVVIPLFVATNCTKFKIILFLKC